MAVDANRDGFIKFAGNYNDGSVSGKPTDTTSEAKPFRFWVNSDDDKGAQGTEQVPVATHDNANNRIGSVRDLEDFTRLWLHVGAFYDEIANGTFKIGLKWRNATGTPVINVYKSADPDGSDSYVKDDQAGQDQFADEYKTAIATVSGTNAAILPPDYWTGYSEQNPKKCFLFEGIAEGKGQLCITIHKSDGSEIGEGGGIWLDLKDVKKMYERGKANPEPSGYPRDYIIEYPPATQIGFVGDGPPFVAPPDEAKQAIVFVHGINGPGGGSADASYNSWISMSESVFKRLWHQGFKGRFASFKWPALTPALPFQYNYSEYRALKSGQGLAAFVGSLPNDYKKNLYSFSQGAVVCGSALTTYQLTVNNYVMSQAAFPAGCYDISASVNSYADFLDKEAQSPTPDNISALGYRGYLTSLNVSGAVTSFYNTSDYALKIGVLLGQPANWEGNQISYKPNAFTGRSYKYEDNIWYNAGSNEPWISRSGRVGMLLINGSTTGRYVTDVHESMSFIARPRSDAAGANTSVAGSIGGRYDVGPDTPCDFRDAGSDHGGQFDRRIQKL